MNVEVNREELLAAVRQAATATMGKAALRVLSCVLIEAAEGRMKMSGTDLKVSVESHIEAEVTEPGAALVDAQRIQRMLERMNAETVSLSSDKEHTVIISGGTSSYQVFGLPPAEFPPIHDSEGTSFQVDAPLVRKMFERVMYATGNDQARYNLTGVNWAFSAERWQAAASDGLRMATVQAKPIEGIEGEYLIPGPAAAKIINVLSGKGEVTITIPEHESRIRFDFGDASVTTALIEAKFVNVDMVMRSAREPNVTVAREDLLAMLGRAAIIEAKLSCFLCIEVAAGVMTMKQTTKDLGEFSDQMDIIEGEDAGPWYFTRVYLEQALRQFQHDEVRIGIYRDGSNPIAMRIQDEAGEDDAVVMPVRK